MLLLLFLLLLTSPLLRRQSMQHDQSNCKVWNNSFILHEYRFDSIRIIELIHQKWCIFSTMVTSFDYLVYYLCSFFHSKKMNKKWIQRIRHWFNRNIKYTLIDFYSRLTTIIRINFDIRHNGHHCKWWIVFQCDGVWCVFLSIISPNSDNSGDIHTHIQIMYVWTRKRWICICFVKCSIHVLYPYLYWSLTMNESVIAKC